LPPTFSDVDDLAYFYLDFIEELDLTDCILVGSSFGGWIAAELAIKASPRFSHLVLAGAVGVKFGDRESRDIRDLLSLTIGELPETLFHDPVRAAVMPLLRDHRMLRQLTAE
jgi:pimeloyl-ACP methyl ester carboxylesterase